MVIFTRQGSPRTAPVGPQPQFGQTTAAAQQSSPATGHPNNTDAGPAIDPAARRHVL